MCLVRRVLTVERVSVLCQHTFHRQYRRHHLDIYTALFYNLKRTCREENSQFK